MSRSALIYTAAAAIAIAALAFVALRDPAQQATPTPENHAALQALREGSMKKLAFHPSPKPAGTATFELAEGGKGSLADHKGHYVLVNFWATWCAPCRKEMKGLSELQRDLGGDDFEVLTIATGRNMPVQIDKFFSEIGVTNLPRHRDPTQGLAHQMGVLGLPVSVIVDPSGHEIARMVGDAEWDSDSARAIVKALIDG